MNSKKKLIFYFITSLMILGLFLVLELIGWGILKVKERPTYPVLINRTDRKGTTIRNVLDTRFSAVDPHLGHSDPITKDPNARWIPGFAVYEPELGSATAGSLIVTLGGSTTASNAFFNWPRELFLAATKSGYRIRVYNGGVSGYSSNQELIKLLRDVLPLKPNIVLSLSGINDLGFIHCVNDHPMVTPYQRKLMEYLVTGNQTPPLLFPNLFMALQTLLPKTRPSLHVNYGPEVKTQPWNQWVRNMRLMHSVCEEFNIEFLAALQPVMGAGEFRPTEEESEMFRTAVEANPHYKRAVRVFYERVRPMIAEIPWCLDWTDLFKNESDVYKDARHQNEKGVRIIGTSFLAELRNRKWLESSSGLVSGKVVPSTQTREETIAADLAFLREEEKNFGGFAEWKSRLKDFREVLKETIRRAP